MEQSVEIFACVESFATRIISFSFPFRISCFPSGTPNYHYLGWFKPSLALTRTFLIPRESTMHRGMVKNDQLYLNAKGGRRNMATAGRFLTSWLRETPPVGHEPREGSVACSFLLLTMTGRTWQKDTWKQARTEDEGILIDPQGSPTRKSYHRHLLVLGPRKRKEGRKRWKINEDDYDMD